MSEDRVTFSIPNAAAALDVSAKTIRNLVSRGDLRAARIGTRILIPRTELEAYVAGRVRDTFEPAAVGTRAPAYRRKAG